MMRSRPESEGEAGEPETHVSLAHVLRVIDHSPLLQAQKDQLRRRLAENSNSATPQTPLENNPLWSDFADQVIEILNISADLDSPSELVRASVILRHLTQLQESHQTMLDTREDEETDALDRIADLLEIDETTWKGSTFAQKLQRIMREAERVSPILASLEDLEKDLDLAGLGQNLKTRFDAAIAAVRKEEGGKVNPEHITLIIRAVLASLFGFSFSQLSSEERLQIQFEMQDYGLAFDPDKV